MPESNYRCFSKTSPGHGQRDKYRIAYKKEFHLMKRLELLMEQEGHAHTYTRLFPRYDSLWEDADGMQHLNMEYLHGKSLETYLCNFNPRNNPYQLLHRNQILHIYKQLSEALAWLMRVDMLYLDLSPQNILLVNETNDFNIRLIDFTNCYDMKLSPEKNHENGYKIIDCHIDPSLPLPLQLRNACALLFTRLFFSGSICYKRYFSANLKKEEGRRCRDYFQNKYPHLLDCIFSPQTIPDADENGRMDSWSNWMRQLFDSLQ